MRLRVLICIVLLALIPGGLAAADTVALGGVVYVFPAGDAAEAVRVSVRVEGEVVDPDTLAPVRSGLLAGAVFGVYAMDGGGNYVPYPDPDNPLQPLRLETGTPRDTAALPRSATLYLHQEAAPEGYVADDAYIPLSPPQEVTVVNRREGMQGLWLTLRSDEGQPLSGGLFAVEGPGGSYTLKTDESGRATLIGLAPGEYSLTQVQSPDGYTVEASAVALTVEANVPVQLDMVNSRHATLALRTDGLTVDDARIARVVPVDRAYDVLDAQGAFLGQVRTGSPLSLPAAQEGTAYTLRQAASTQPDGYAADDETHTITLYPGTTTTHQTLVPSTGGFFTLAHVDAESGSAVPGGSFRLTDAQGEAVLFFEADTAGQYTPAAPIPAGTYTLAMERAADGYQYTGAAQEVVISPYLDAEVPVAQVTLASPAVPDALYTAEVTAAAQALPSLFDAAAAIDFTLQISADTDALSIENIRYTFALPHVEGMTVMAQRADGASLHIARRFALFGTPEIVSLEVEGTVTYSFAYPIAAGELREITVKKPLAVTVATFGAAQTADYAVYGRVYDEEGVAAAGQRVELVSADGTALAEAVTDPFGTYAFAQTREGAVVQVKTPEGYGARMEGGDARLLPLRTVSGQVRAHGPIDRDAVTLRMGTVSTAVPDAGGYFTMTGPYVPADTLAVEVAEGILFTVETEGDTALVDLYAPASVSGHALTPEGQPVAGVRVQLQGDARTVQTDAAGRFVIDGLLPGEYVLHYAAPEGRVLAGAASQVVALSAGDALDTPTIIAMTPGAIEGVLLEGSEPYAGIAVTLLPMGDTAYTDDAGAYAFEGLALGTYTLSFALPEDALLMDVPGEIVIAQSGQRESLMLHAVRYASISGRIWQDLNDDGYVTADEPGVGGAGVRLEDRDGAEVARAETDRNGNFTFGALMPGEYRMVIALPDGLIFARSAPDTARMVVDVDASEAATGWYTVASGEHLRGLVCGAVEAGSIEGGLWRDTNGDGQWSEGEAGMPGVSVTLRRQGEVMAQVITGEDGAMRFDQLRPGNYEVVLVLPQGHLFTRRAATTAEAVGSQAPDTDDDTAVLSVSLKRWRMSEGVYAGVQQAGSLAVTVWYDADAGGTSTGGPGQAGVEVALYREGGSTPVATQTTDAVGNVLFGGLRADTYRLQVAPALQGEWGYTAGVDTVQGNAGTTAALHVGQGAQVQAAAIGITRLGNISGQVFEDADYDGLRGAAEAGVAGATVSLLNAGGAVLRTAQVGVDGAYRFDRLMTGLYAIEVELPGAYAFTKARKDAPSFNSDVPQTVEAFSQTDAMYLPPGEALLVDAGAFRRGVIGGTLWQDTAANGRRAGSSPVLPGIAIALLQGGETVAATATDERGAFAFGDLPPGSYTIAASLAGGMRLSPAIQREGNDDTFAYELGHGVKKADLDIGVVYTGSVEGLARDARSDAGLAGVKVALVRDGQTIHETETAADGAYRFADLLPGDAVLHFTMPDTWIFAQAGDAVQPVQVQQGQQAQAQPLACVPQAVIEIGLWLDADADGLRGDGEAALPGVSVELCSVDEEARILAATGMSDGEGLVRFDGLLPGVYVLALTPPEGVLLYGGHEIGPFEVGMGGEVSLALPAYQAASIAGRVWEDLNNDGLFTRNEPLLAAVTVTLLDGAGQAMQTVETDGAGRYRFDGVPPVLCSVHFALPEAYIFTSPAEGGSVVPQMDSIQGATEPMRMEMGMKAEGIDAGALRHTRIGDLVWLDRNGNGLQDTEEPGLAGMHVDLIRVSSDGGEVVVAQAQTDANGRYRFDAVRPGTYRVAFEPGDLYLPTRPVEGLDQINSKLPWMAGPTVMTPVFTAESGRHQLAIDAGFVTLDVADALGWTVSKDGFIED